MSGYVEDTIDVAIDCAVAVGKAIVVTAEVIGVAAIMAGKAAFEVAVFTGRVGRALISTSISLSKDVIENIKKRKKQQEELIRHQIQAQEQAYTTLESRVAHDPQLLKNSNERLFKNINFASIEFDQSHLEAIEKLNDADKFKVLSALVNYSHFSSQLDEILFLLNDEQHDISFFEQQIINIDHEIKKAVINKDVSQIIALSNELNKLFIEIRKVVNEIAKKERTRKIEKTEGILYNIENKISLPFNYLFKNELSEIIFETFKKDLEKELLNEIQKYADESLEISEKILGLEYLQDIDALSVEIDNLLASLFKIEKNENLSVQTRHAHIQTRYESMKRVYSKAQRNNKEIILQKENYDKVYMEVFNLEKFLEIELTPYDFNFKHVEKQIKQLEVKREQLKTLTEEKLKKDKVRKALQKAMRKLNYEYIVSDDNEFASSDIFHMGDGNIVRVTLTKSGSIRYLVSGVKLPGFETNKWKIVKGQEKFCDIKKEIDKELKLEDIVILSNDELLDPHESYAFDETLPEHTPIQKINVIRKGKMINRRINGKKERKIDETR